VAAQELNLEQTDFSAGYVSDVNPLTFPPNATVDEQNFELRVDGSRQRRRGLAFDTDSLGDIIVPDASFFNSDLTTSVVYSTISPNSNDGDTYDGRKQDVLTVSDVSGSGNNLYSYNAKDDTFSILPHSATNGESPFFVTKYATRQAYVSVGSGNYQLSLIYGYDTTDDKLGVTSQSSIVYSAGTNITNNSAKISDIVAWSGRMVYAFNNTDDSSGLAIGISQLPDPTDSAVNQVAVLAKCQAVDAENLVDTDGVWVTASDLGAIQRVVPYRTGLLIFTSDNIWYLYSEQGYFNPYDFRFDKISDTKVAGNNSIVIRDNVLMFWADSGIYLITPDENTGLPKLKNISENRIQKWYESILPGARRKARGIYNKENNEVRWLYNSSVGTLGSVDARQFDAEIVMSMANGAYTFNKFPYDSTITTNSTYVIEYIPDNAVDADFDNSYVFTTSGGDVTVGGENVYAEFLVNFRYTSSFKYVIRDGATTAKVGSLEDTSFYDFVGSDQYTLGVDANAYMKSGYFTMDSTQTRKTPNYITTTFKATETGYNEDTDELLGTSGCFLTAYWNYANDGYTGKVHGPYQVYRLNRLYMPETPWAPGQDYIATKNKIRGRGRTLQFKFETEDGKDCQLYAWGYNGNVLTRV
jgi:hypothetical protein